MDDKLLPCPFCGGEAELIRKRARNGETLYRYRCSKCHAAIGQWHGGISGCPWTARETWNTRTERMCQNIGVTQHEFKCSGCGVVWCVPYLGTFWYCPYCGAKVVER